MGKEVDVGIGKLEVSKKNRVFVARALGSCVGLAMYDKKKKMGGMAHVMPPGNAPVKEGVIPARYAVNSIDQLIQQFSREGISKEKLMAVIVGGGNVLRRKYDTIGADNISAVSRQLKGKQIEIKANSVSGTQRKSARFDVGKGRIFVAAGDDNETILYDVL